MAEEQRFLSTAEAARVLACSPRSLQRWRWTGDGPPFHRIRRRVVYSLGDVLDFAGRPFKSTHEADLAQHHRPNLDGR